MAAAVEVVGQAQSQTASQILLKSQVSLLGIGLNKSFSLRIAKRLESQREKGCRIQVGLIDEQAGIEGIKALLVRQVARNRRQARSGVQNALENVGRVQAARVRGHARVAGVSTRKEQLPALRTVGGI